MRASLLAVGSELLRFGRRDTNGEWLTRRLNRHGVDVVGRTTLADDAGAIADCLAAAAERCELLIVTGGLGPTRDDCTRDALARALGRPLERDPERVRRLRARFAARGVEYRAVQSVQADRPGGAAWIENPLGSAPGVSIDHGSCRVIALPGVPAEMKAMFEQSVDPWLAARTDGTAIARASLRIAGCPEAEVEARVGDLYGSGGVEVTILSGEDGVELHLQAAGGPGDPPGPRVAALERALRGRLGRDVYGGEGDRLAAVVGQLLIARGATLAAAESCTAGLLTAALTESAGASAWFRGGVAAYHDDLKRELLGVDAALLVAHGAVSVPVARAMASAVRVRTGSTFGVAVTGIAGPGGGTPDKPVGRVVACLAGPGTTTDHVASMSGDRGSIRRRTVTWVLDLLRRRLIT